MKTAAALGSLLAALLVLRGPPAGAAEDADHEALRALREVYERAVNQNDAELLRPYLDPDFSAVTATNQAVSGYEGYKAYWEEYWGHVPVGAKGPHYTARLEPSMSLVYGDLAIAGGTSNDVITTADGKQFPMVARWTVVFHKRAGSWKILRIHASLDPFANPFVLREGRRVAIKAGLGGVLAGALLGWFARRAWERR